MSTNSLPSFVHAIGGSIGSALAILTFYPLERVRIELQTNQHDGTKPKNDATLDNAVGDEFVLEDRDESVSEPVAKFDASSASTSSNESFELVHAADGELTTHEGGSYDIRNVPSVQSSDDNAASKLTTPKKSRIRTNQNKTSLPPESILQCLLRLQKQKSLYNGASHMTTTLMVSNFVFFYALQVCRRYLDSFNGGQKHSQSHNTKKQHTTQLHVLHNIVQKILRSKMATSLLSSTIAGMVNVLMTNPLWVASLRIMEGKVTSSSGVEAIDKTNRKQPNLWSVMYAISKSEGVQKLWSGTWTSLLLVSNPILQHFIYEQMRSWFLGMNRRRHDTTVFAKEKQQPYRDRIMSQVSTLTPLQAFMFGALAKAVATVLTYPLQLAQVLLRSQTKQIASNRKNDRREDEQNEIYNGTIDCLYHQFTLGGVPALFLGMNAKLLQTVLTSAFTFLTYEQILVLVARVYDTLK